MNRQHKIRIADLNLTGTPSVSTYARGDGAWEVPLETLTYTLTPTQIKTMYPDPGVEVLAAPGAGLVRVFWDITWIFVFNRVRYTGGGSTNLVEAGAGGSLMSGSFAAKDMNNNQNRFQWDTSSASAKVFNENRAWNLRNSTAVFADGDSTLKIIVRYKTVPIA
jgi:hypothetical protein